jgi:hypothetical protein
LIGAAACDAGRYGSTTDLTSAACSGPCSPGGSDRFNESISLSLLAAVSGYFCLAGSNSSTAALCPAGYYCPANTAAGTDNRCSLQSQSPAGSRDVTDCKCSPGYLGADGTACLGTAAGRYKATVGDFPSTPCPAGRFGAAPAEANPNCTGPCAPNNYCPLGSESATAFACPGNRQSPLGSKSLADCQGCVAGFFDVGSNTCQGELIVNP